MKWRAEQTVMKTKWSPSFERTKKNLIPTLIDILHYKIIELEGIRWSVILNKTFNFFKMFNFFMFLDRIFEKFNLSMQKLLAFCKRYFSRSKSRFLVSRFKVLFQRVLSRRKKPLYLKIPFIKNLPYNLASWYIVFLCCDK